MHLLKRLSIGTYELYTLGIIVFAACLRILLASQGWPPTNSDEGTMGIMARHIAYNGGHPIFFYGQNYMGALEAYLAAAFFHLFGPSLLTLRLGVILLVTLFLASMYLLTSLLYTKKLALAVLVLLSLGSSSIFMRELYATGGSTQTLLFGSLAFLLASWLSLSCKQDLSRGRRQLRLAGYAAWGLVLGLGLWCDVIVVPFFVMSALLLLLFCRRDLPTWAPLYLLLGFLIGVSPLLVYNYQAAQGQDSLSVILGLFHGTNVQSPHKLAQLMQGIKEMIQVSLPTATGDPSCPVPALNYVTGAGPQSIQCTIVHTAWGLGYMLLWLLAILLTGRALWKLRSRSHVRILHFMSPEEEQAVTRHFARLFLLASAGITLTIYAASSAPLGLPGSHARYLVGLLIVTPAVIWPLWTGARAIKVPAVKRTPQPGFTRAQVKVAINRGLLLLIGIAFLTGTIGIFSEMPTVQAANQQQDLLIHNLLRIDATHIYTDYWSCDRIAFISQEKIICAVLDDNLQPTHNRDYSYYTIVKADPHSAYVFPLALPQTAPIVRKANLSSRNFQRFVFNGYVVYQPRITFSHNPISRQKLQEHETEHGT